MKRTAVVAALVLSGMVGCVVRTEAERPARAGFYDELSPYGEWLWVEPFGSVWRPASEVVGPGFYPYLTGGRWVYTEYGWTFESQWPWGWVPFHHGRWLWTEDQGWVWVPGDVWGPAWVEWREGPHFVGWVPMGPDGVAVAYVGYQPRWCWVETRYFASEEIHRHVLPPERHAEHYHQATAVSTDVGASYPRGPSVHSVSAVAGPVPTVSMGPPRQLGRGSVAAERRLTPPPGQAQGTPPPGEGKAGPPPGQAGSASWPRTSPPPPSPWQRGETRPAEPAERRPEPAWRPSERRPEPVPERRFAPPPEPSRPAPAPVPARPPPVPERRFEPVRPAPAPAPAPAPPPAKAKEKDKDKDKEEKKKLEPEPKKRR